MAEVQINRRPGRAVVFGFMWGLGLAIYLIFVNPVIGLDTIGSVATKAGIVVVGAIVLSLLYAYLAPPKKPKGPAPRSASDEG